MYFPKADQNIYLTKMNNLKYCLGPTHLVSYALI
jgi:hypothetical protein